MEEFSDPVEDFLNQQIPAEVWHYTTCNNFRGIIESGSLWATEAHHTNDSTEFVHARDIALVFLKTTERPNEHYEFALTEAYKVVESVFNKGALSVNEAEVFIASFSAAKDLKSQWENYADHHRGVSIGFDLRYIRPPKGSGIGITFSPCVYEQAGKESLIRSALSHFVQQCAESHMQATDNRWLLEQLIDYKKNMQMNVSEIPLFDKTAFLGYIEQKLNNIILFPTIKTSFDLLRLASHCKNHDFFEEKEWRLAIPVAKDNNRKRVVVKYWGQDHSIPYIETKLISPEKLPITRVMLGPLCDRRNEIEEILLSRGYSVPIGIQIIP